MEYKASPILETLYSMRKIQLEELLPTVPASSAAARCVEVEAGHAAEDCDLLTSDHLTSTVLLARCYISTRIELFSFYRILASLAQITQ